MSRPVQIPLPFARARRVATQALTAGTKATRATTATLFVGLVAASGWMALPVQAAGTASYALTAPGPDGGKGRLTVEWTDTRHARITVEAEGMPPGMSTYNLVLGDQLYGVTTHEGKTTVMELGALLRMAGGMMPALSGPADATDVAEVQALESTGRRETVAGLAGQVYTLRYRDEAGASQTREIVLGHEGALRELSEVMQHYASLMSRATGKPAKPDALNAAIAQRHTGMLRMGTEVQLARFSRQAPAPQRLALPAEPMKMPDLSGMPGLGSLMGQAARPAAGQAGAQAPGVVKTEAERQRDRQSERVSNRVRSETDQAVDQTVDKVVGGLLDKLLGR
jgi:hypothetical protein